MKTKAIVIVGGGFAGTTLAQVLDRRLPSDHELTLVSEESYTTFNPMLPEAVGASIFPEQVVAPIRQMVRHGRFIMGRVSAIDGAQNARLLDARGRGRSRLRASGARLREPGAARSHSGPCRARAAAQDGRGDAMHIRNVVLRRVARIELESDAVLRRRLGHFVVIGGGFSGVEVAGELVDCLKSIRRYYPRVAADELKVTVLHDQPALLPELPEELGAAALRSLDKRRVEVRLGARAAAVTDAAVTLAGGEVLGTATVICTIGTRPNGLVEALSVPTERGRIVVGADLAVQGTPGVWAIGDCAHIVNARDGKAAPTTAQFAVREAPCLAQNLLAAIAGRPTRPFDYRARGSMAAIGHMKGVAEIFGLRLSGLPAWLLWRAYYLSQMPTLGRKLRIFVEWSWGMFFPTDITHLRFTRSQELLD